MEAEKTIVSFPGWSEPDESNYIWFDVVLEVGGVVDAAFTFHGGCCQTIPDRHLTFELRVRRQPGRRCIPLARICWRSLTGHTNRRGVGPPELAGRRLSSSHYHSFDLNWLPNGGRMRGGNLPLAMNLRDGLDSYAEVREFVGSAFNINNITVIENPLWEAQLL
jgi:hypothetical protein